MFLDGLITFMALVIEMLMQLTAAFFLMLAAALREKGRARLVPLLAAASAIYLVLAIVRGLVPNLALTLPSALFAWPVVTAAVLVVLFTAPLTYIGKLTEGGLDWPEGSHVNAQTPTALPMRFFYGVFFLFIFGGLSLFSSIFQAPRLIESTCAKVLAPVPEAVMGRAVQLSEKLLDRELKFLDRCLALQKDL